MKKKKNDSFQSKVNPVGLRNFILELRGGIIMVNNKRLVSRIVLGNGRYVIYLFERASVKMSRVNKRDLYEYKIW